MSKICSIMFTDTSFNLIIEQGDYLATLTPNAGAQAVAIHQVRMHL